MSTPSLADSLGHPPAQGLSGAIPAFSEKAKQWLASPDTAYTGTAFIFLSPIFLVLTIVFDRIDSLLLSLLVFAPFSFGMLLVLVPRQIGAIGVVFPRLLALCLWMFLVAGLLAVTDPDLARLAVSVGLASVVWMLVSVNVVVTVLTMRTPGLSLPQMGLMSWSALVSGTVALICLPVLIAGTVLTFLAVNDGGRMSSSVQSLVSQLTGEPIIYFFLIPLLGLVSEAVGAFAGRPLIGGPVARLVIALSAGLALFAWTIADGGTSLRSYEALLAAPVGLLALLWAMTILSSLQMKMKRRGVEEVTI